MAGIPLEVPLADRYNIGSPDVVDREQKEPTNRLEKIKDLFGQRGTVTTIRGIFLLLVHGHPHVLFLKKRNKLILPGGIAQPGQADEDNLRDCLQRKLWVDGLQINSSPLAIWYRPQFTDFIYPYLPVHITEAKEIEIWYPIILPPEGRIIVASQYDDCSAISFYDLQNGAAEYGNQFASIPLLFSRYQIIPKEQQ